MLCGGCNIYSLIIQDLEAQWVKKVSIFDETSALHDVSYHRVILFYRGCGLFKGAPLPLSVIRRDSGLPLSGPLGLGAVGALSISLRQEAVGALSVSLRQEAVGTGLAPVRVGKLL